MNVLSPFGSPISECSEDSRRNISPLNTEKIKKQLNVLIIEDKDDDAFLIILELENAGYHGNFKQVDSRESMEIALNEMKWDMILSDFNVPGFNAYESLDLLKSTKIDLPFIIISGTVGEETAVRLMRKGAKDFILKNNLKRLIPVIEREISELENRQTKNIVEKALLEQRNQNEYLEKLQRELILKQDILIAKEIELTRSNQYLNQFANMASHDLREPLRMVKQFVMLLSKRYKDKLDSDANEFIGFCIDGVERMEEMIKSILDYAKLNKLGISLEVTNSEVALERAKLNLMAAIEESSADITNDELPLLKFNPGQLTQIFQNLLSNAIKYRSTGSSSKIHIKVEKKGKNWLFCVSDNGIGIKPENFEKIFNQFQRLHSNEEYEGIGLGLSFCKKMIKQYGGEMWVESEVGKGSSFFFLLPR
jgi:signal transduction histidine kinase